VLAAVAGVAWVSLDGVADRAARDATGATMAALRSASLGTEATPGFYGDVGRSPARAVELAVAPVDVPAYVVATRTGWRGPYARATTTPYVVDVVRGFTAAYGDPGDPMPIDAWGRPIVLQVPDADGDGSSDAVDVRHARWVSAGEDGRLSTPRRDADAIAPGDSRLPTLGQCGDDLVLFLHVPDTRAP